jgi:hypothetical protein
VRARHALKAAAVLALLHAAIVLAAGKGEYPALTRAGTRFLAGEVLPATIAAWVSLGLLGAAARPAPMRVLAHAVNVAVLALAISRFQPGSPPAAWMFVLVSALLVLAGLATERTVRRAPEYGAPP